MYRHIADIVQLASTNDPCYIQNRVVMKRVIKRSRCIEERNIYGSEHIRENQQLENRHFQPLFACFVSKSPFHKTT